MCAGMVLFQLQKTLTWASNRASAKQSGSQCQWFLKSILVYVLARLDTVISKLKQIYPFRAEEPLRL